MMTTSLRRDLDRELAQDETTMAIIARSRRDLRGTLTWTADCKLAKGEHFRLAALAMATLGQPDEVNPHRNSRGERVTVGPYVSQAVAYVLHGIEHDERDRQLILSYAMLINVARRI